MSQSKVPKHHCSGHKQGTVTTATHKSGNSATKTISLCKDGKIRRLITIQKKRLAGENMPCEHVDSCVNTLLTAPMRHGSKDPVLFFRRRGSKSCQCQCQKRMGYKASAKEIQTSPERITQDRSCIYCIPTETRSIQFTPARAIVLTQTLPSDYPMKSAEKKSMRNVKVGFKSCFTVDTDVKDVNIKEFNKSGIHSRARRWSIGTGYHIRGPDF